MDSYPTLNSGRYLILWLLLISPTYSDIISSSDYPQAWTTKTIEETITVECGTAAMSSTIISSGLMIYTSSHDIISGPSTTQMGSYSTSDSPSHTTEIQNASNLLNATSTYLAFSETSPTTSSTSLTSSVTSLTISVTSSSHSTLSTQTETVLSGSSLVSLGMTQVSIGSSGAPVIGTNTPILSSGSSAPNFFTIGSQTATTGSTGLEPVPSKHLPPLPTATARVSVVPGGAPVTIGTVTISLGQDGVLVISGSTRTVSATVAEIITIDGETITASSNGFLMEVPTSAAAGFTTIITGSSSFVFSTSFVSISDLTTWSKTTTELPDQTTPTVLPIWPCLNLCTSGYNGVIMIPESPLPPSSVTIPAPFTFSPLEIGSDGIPTARPMVSPTVSATLPTVIAMTTTDSISSTLTTVPPGFSTEATTNMLWTANTWLTTNVGGGPTIVPVLVGCPGCGGLHGGIILWNLPELPRVSFQFPQFPGLPHFHLPCIKFFGIRITGDCDSPPRTDGDGSNNPTNTERSPSWPSKSSASSVAPISSSSSSTLPCSSTAAPSCTQICNLITQSAGVVASSCASAVCQTITACFATPTTSTIYSVTTTSEWICAATCSACVGGSRSSASSVQPSSTSSVLVKRVLDQPSDPNDETLRFNWFIRKMKSITTLADDMFEYAPDDFEGLSSSLIDPLTDNDGTAGIKADAVGVEDLHGCMTVIVASPEAIWLGHFWQTSFRTETKFQHDMLDFLFAGANRGQDRNWPGLQIYIDDPQQPSHPFAPAKNPVVLIVAARNRTLLNLDAPAYPNMVGRMKAALQAKFTGSTIQSFNYIPANTRRDLEGVFGKVLVQYDPAHPDCNNIVTPTIRIWVQGNVVLDAPFYNYPMPAQTGQMRRDAFNASCPLSWGQSVAPYEITATYTMSPTRYRATTTPLSTTVLYKLSSSSANPSQSTTLSTSTVSSSAAGKSLFCSPSTSPESGPTGLPQNQIAQNITDFCAAIEQNSRILKGCDNQFHNGILLSVDCNGASNAFGGPFVTSGMQYKYPGISAWLNATLVQGKSFIVNSSICNSALSTVLKDCLMITDDNSLPPANSFGGGVVVLDGTGGGANFSIDLVSANTPGQSGVPDCAYVTASILRGHALCAADYCECGGAVAPLLTSTISGSTILNCAYSTQPTTATCPPPPTMTTSVLPSVHPTGTTCDCNENGCTPESPPCCANGSCGA